MTVRFLEIQRFTENNFIKNYDIVVCLNLDYFFNCLKKILIFCK